MLKEKSARKKFKLPKNCRINPNLPANLDEQPFIKKKMAEVKYIIDTYGLPKF